MLETLLQKLYKKTSYRNCCVHRSQRVVELHENIIVQIARGKKDLTIWHEKFGHLGGKNLRFFIQKKFSQQIGCQKNATKLFELNSHKFMWFNKDHFNGHSLIFMTFIDNYTKMV
jgi:hypothetical protein